jgi:hypothetical protein
LVAGIKNLKEYQLKPLHRQIKEGITSKVSMPPLSLEQYKRFVEWFKENLMEGLEKPPVPTLAEQKDSLKREMSNFFDKTHDFSIWLISKRKFSATMSQKPKHIIDVDMAT